MKTLLFALALLLAAGGAAQAAGDEMKFPYFVSFKADEVFMREGPSKEHRIKWVYHRRGLPVQVLAAFDVWRRVSDMDGTEGWVHRTMLSPTRTAVLIGKGDAALHAKADLHSDALAQVQVGAIGELERCQGEACELDFGDLDGWIDRTRLWGVNAGD
jgi:SH3-like domain-containing protein